VAEVAIVAVSLTLPLAVYAAGQIWRYRKHIAIRWLGPHSKIEQIERSPLP
jgi:hypothetical protein